MVNKHVKKPADNVRQHSDMVIFGTFEQDVFLKAGDKGDEFVVAATPKFGEPSTLSLHNTFSILNEESVIPSEEARLADNEPFQNSNGEFIENLALFDTGSKETVNLTQNAHSKVHGDLMNAPFESTSLISSKNTTVTAAHATDPLFANEASGSELVNLSQIDSAEIVDNVSKEIDHLNQVATSMVSTSVNNESFAPSILISNQSMLDADDGLKSLTTSGPHSSEQYNKTGRRFSPSAATVSVNFAKDPRYGSPSVPDEATTVATPLIMPITVYDEILGPDKGKISAPATIKNTTAACRKSEKILNKFWADELETDQASDNTLDLDNNAERSQDFFSESTVDDQYLMQNTATTKKGKRGRPRKPKSPKILSCTRTKNKHIIEHVDDGFDGVLTHGVSGSRGIREVYASTF